jgi:general secretion pathway protein F
MRYAVKAMRGEAVIDVELDAEDSVAAREEAARRGYEVLAVRRRGISLTTRIVVDGKFPVALFTSQLIALLDAGLNLVEALQALAFKEKTSQRRRVLDSILSTLNAGQTFSQAIARLPMHFPRVYVAIVHASERTGDLQRALQRFLDYEQKFDHVRKKVASALLYPAILIVVGTLVLTFLMFYVVPRFARIYEDMSSNLPFFSQLLFTLGGWIDRHGWMVAGIVIALSAIAGYALSRQAFRSELVARLWRVRHVGEALRLYQLARLYGTLGMLLRSGVAIVPSMSMSTGLLSTHLRPQLGRAQTMIEEGASISSAMAAAGLSTAIADQMMVVGERSGRMGEMMERIAAFHDDDMARWLDWTMRTFEPLLMTVIGVAVGLVVVLMYMPVFELAGSLG